MGPDSYIWLREIDYDRKFANYEVFFRYNGTQSQINIGSIAPVYEHYHAPFLFLGTANRTEGWSDKDKTSFLFDTLQFGVMDYIPGGCDVSSASMQSFYCSEASETCGYKLQFSTSNYAMILPGSLWHWFY